jgi:membrane protein
MPRDRHSLLPRWRDILTRTFKETMEDDANGLAAQLSYYFFLALFPTLLALVALASLFPLGNFSENVTRFLDPIAPAAVLRVIREQMLEISKGDHPGLMSVGLIGALWSSSAAMGAVVNAMNRAYDIQDPRPWWRVRGIALLLTVGLSLFILVSLSLVLAGPEFAALLARWFGFSQVFVWTWTILQWPLVFILVALGIGLIYRFAPYLERHRAWVTPGSITATALWLLGSIGFRMYITRFNAYQTTYGTLGGVIVLLLWFYVSGFAIIVGAELDSEIAATKEPPEH